MWLVPVMLCIVAAAGGAERHAPPPPILKRCAPAGDKEARVVVPGLAVVNGRVECTHRAFLGIPYAAPPTGDLRWKPPRPVAQPVGQLPVYNATVFKPACIQLRSERLSDIGKLLIGVKSESEDCLYVNIFTPRSSAGSKQQRLPVILFIHGGAFSTGGSSAPLYNPADLLQNGLRSEALFVTFDYRLGIFGYLASKALLGESDTEPVGNYGLQDQLLVIEWIRTHIGAFGGDPGNLTVMGHSAGAMSASYLQLVLQDPSIKWILLSGTALGWDWKRADGAFENRVWERLTKGVGCDVDDPGCMRSVDPAKLTAVGQSLSMDYLFGPTIDGRLIADRPDILLKQGFRNIGPSIITVVKDEATLFIGSTIKTPQDYERLVHEYFAHNPAAVSQILQKYTPQAYKSAFSAANAAITDAVFTCPGLRYTRLLSSAFFAQFDAPLLLPSMASMFMEGRDYGVFHGSDLILLFNFNPFITLPNLRQMEGMREGLRRFIRSGSPLNPEKAMDKDNIWYLSPVLFRGHCQDVWGFLEGRPALPKNFRSKIPLTEYKSTERE